MPLNFENDFANKQKTIEELQAEQVAEAEKIAAALGGKKSGKKLKTEVKDEENDPGLNAMDEPAPSTTPKGAKIADKGKTADMQAPTEDLSDAEKAEEEGFFKSYVVIVDELIEVCRNYEKLSKTSDAETRFKGFLVGLNQWKDKTTELYKKRFGEYKKYAKSGQQDAFKESFLKFLSEEAKKLGVADTGNVESQVTPEDLVILSEYRERMANLIDICQDYKRALTGEGADQELLSFFDNQMEALQKGMEASDEKLREGYYKNVVGKSIDLDTWEKNWEIFFLQKIQEIKEAKESKKLAENLEEIFEGQKPTDEQHTAKERLAGYATKKEFLKKEREIIENEEISAAIEVRWSLLTDEEKQPYVVSGKRAWREATAKSSEDVDKQEYIEQKAKELYTKWLEAKRLEQDSDQEIEFSKEAFYEMVRLKYKPEKAEVRKMGFIGFRKEKIVIPKFGTGFNSGDVMTNEKCEAWERQLEQDVNKRVEDKLDEREKIYDEVGGGEQAMEADATAEELEIITTAEKRLDDFFDENNPVIFNNEDFKKLKSELRQNAQESISDKKIRSRVLKALKTLFNKKAIEHNEKRAEARKKEKSVVLQQEFSLDKGTEKNPVGADYETFKGRVQPISQEAMNEAGPEILRRQEEALVECEVFIDREFKNNPDVPFSELSGWVNTFSKDYQFNGEQVQFLQDRVDSYRKKREKFKPFWEKYKGDIVGLIKKLTGKDITSQDAGNIEIEEGPAWIIIKTNREILNKIKRGEFKECDGLANQSKGGISYVAIESAAAQETRILKEESKESLTKTEKETIESDTKEILKHESQHVVYYLKNASKEVELEKSIEETLDQYNKEQDPAEREKKLENYLIAERSGALDRVKNEILACFHSQGLRGLKKRLGAYFLTNEKSSYDYLKELRKTEPYKEAIKSNPVLVERILVQEYKQLIENSFTSLFELSKKDGGYSLERAIVFLTKYDFEVWPEKIASFVGPDLQAAEAEKAFEKEANQIKIEVNALLKEDNYSEISKKIQEIYKNINEKPSVLQGALLATYQEELIKILGPALSKRKSELTRIYEDRKKQLEGQKASLSSVVQFIRKLTPFEAGDEKIERELYEAYYNYSNDWYAIEEVEESIEEITSVNGKKRSNPAVNLKGEESSNEKLEKIFLDKKVEVRKKLETAQKIAAEGKSSLVKKVRNFVFGADQELKERKVEELENALTKLTEAELERQIKDREGQLAMGIKRTEEEMRALQEELRQFQMQLYVLRGGKNPVREQQRLEKKAQEEAKKILEKQDILEKERKLEEEKNNRLENEKRASTKPDFTTMEKEAEEQRKIEEEKNDLEFRIKTAKNLSELSAILKDDVLKKYLYKGVRKTAEGPDTLEQLTEVVDALNWEPSKDQLDEVTKKNIVAMDVKVDRIIKGDNFSSNEALREAFTRLARAKMDELLAAAKEGAADGLPGSTPESLSLNTDDPAVAEALASQSNEINKDMGGESVDSLSEKKFALIEEMAKLDDEIKELKRNMPSAINIAKHQQRLKAQQEIALKEAAKNSILEQSKKLTKQIEKLRENS